VDQTYRNLEIILVDDGSRDQSGSLCDEWAKKDHRIRVIHKENGGMSDARNTGIKAATGELFGFVDSDDIIVPEYYEALYRNMVKQKADISCCQFEKALDFSGCKWEKEQEEILICYHTKEALAAMLEEKDLYVTVWNKLYRRKVVEQVVFEVGKYHEDEFWSCQVLGNAKTIVSSNYKLYGYRQRSDSIMNQSYCYKHLDLLDARVQRLEYFKRYYTEFVITAKCNLRFECIRAMQFCMQYLEGQEFADGKKRILKVVKENPLMYKDYKHLPKGRQVWCFLSNLAFLTTCRIRNRFHFDHEWRKMI